MRLNQLIGSLAGRVPKRRATLRLLLILEIEKLYSTLKYRPLEGGATSQSVLAYRLVISLQTRSSLLQTDLVRIRETTNRNMRIPSLGHKTGESDE